MVATIVNALLIMAGSLLGMLFRNRIHERFSKTIFAGLGLCVGVIGISGAIDTQNMLCVIICTVLGTVLGEVLDIERHLDSLGDHLKRLLMHGRGEGRFTEGFVTATLLFCVGSMAIVGSIEAGIHGDYSIILSKAVMDGIASITLAATMGVGVLFSGFAVLIYQGILTMLAIWVAPVLTDSVITEMSAVGGILIMGLSVNMLGLLGERKLRIGSMLPSVLLPIAYLPVSELIAGVLK